MSSSCWFLIILGLEAHTTLPTGLNPPPQTCVGLRMRDVGDCTCVLAACGMIRSHICPRTKCRGWKIDRQTEVAYSRSRIRNLKMIHSRNCCIKDLKVKLNFNTCYRGQNCNTKTTGNKNVDNVRQKSFYTQAKRNLNYGAQRSEAIHVSTTVCCRLSRDKQWFDASCRRAYDAKQIAYRVSLEQEMMNIGVNSGDQEVAL